MSETERCNFYVGQRVTPRLPVINKQAIAEGIREGGVYTISELVTVSHPQMMSGRTLVCLRFKEITPSRNTLFPDWRSAWDHEGFRPVTDISSLTALLNTASAPNKKEELV